MHRGTARAFVLLVLLLQLLSVRGQEPPFQRLLESPFQDGLHTELLGVYPRPGIGQFVVEVGPYHYFLGSFQIDIFSVSDAGAERVGTYYYADRPRHGLGVDLSNAFPTGLRYPVLDGNRLYVGDYGDLLIFDVTNPLAPVLIKTEPRFFVHQYQNFAVHDGVVFHLDEIQLLATDYSNPDSPRELGSLPQPERVNYTSPWANGKLVIYDNLTPATFRLVDVSDPTAMRIESEVQVPRPSPFGFAYYYAILHGDVAYAVVNDRSWNVIDFSDRANPTVAPIATPGGQAASGAPVVSGTTLMVPAQLNSARTYLYDVADPKNPAARGTIPYAPVAGGSSVSSNRLIMVAAPSTATTTALSVHDISNAQTPSRLFVTNIPAASASGFIGLDPLPAVWNNAAVFHNDVVDFTDPLNPKRRGARSTLPDGGIAHEDVVVDPQSPGRTFDVSTPTVRLLSKPAGETAFVAKSGGLHFWKSGSDLLVTRTNSAEVIATISVPSSGGEIGFVHATNNRVYIQNLIDSEILAIDTSTVPPVLLPNTLRTGGTFAGFYRGLLVFHDAGSSYALVSLADPLQPKQVSSFESPTELSFHGDFAFDGERFYDLPNLGAPRMLGRSPIVTTDFSTARFGSVGSALVTSDRERIYSFRLSALERGQDDFGDGNDTGWHRYDIFASIGHGTYEVQNGTYKLSTPASPSTAIAPAIVGALRPELNFSDSRQQVDVSGWLDSSQDAPLIGLQARSAAHPDGTADFYVANFSPTPFNKPAGTPLSNKPNLSIARTTKFVGVPLAVVEFPDGTFDPAKTYRLTFEVDGTLLDATLAELTTNGLVILGHIQATDSAFEDGYGGFHTLDKNGCLRVGNRPVQATFDNYTVAGVAAAPRLRIDQQGKLYFPATAGGVLEASSDLVEWAPHSATPELSADRLLKFVNFPAGSRALFFRLKL